MQLYDVHLINMGSLTCMYIYNGSLSLMYINYTAIVQLIINFVLIFIQTIIIYVYKPPWFSEGVFVLLILNRLTRKVG